ncbi:MAG: hypothetical protein LBC20_04810 [Planctomycetaceae bacterium]|jgi:hypothetical protein|nr:hypothetical protein [Planctomycetaceae bacterium]
MSNNFSFSSNQHALDKVTFRFWVLCISLLAILPTFCIMGIASAVGNADDAVVGVCALLSILPLIIASIFSVLFLYAVWQQVPPDIARTTPSKAVIFLFIPFFNIYWQFIAIYGLGRDLNQALKQAGLRQQVNETVGLTYCIVSIASCIPAISTLIAIASLIIGLVYMSSLKNGVVKLLTVPQPLDDLVNSK